MSYSNLILVEQSQGYHCMLFSISAAAVWGLNKWDEIERYVQFIPRDTQEEVFYRSLICIHKGQYAQAESVRPQYLYPPCLAGSNLSQSSSNSDVRLVSSS